MEWSPSSSVWTTPVILVGAIALFWEAMAHSPESGGARSRKDRRNGRSHAPQANVMPCEAKSLEGDACGDDTEGDLDGAVDDVATAPVEAHIEPAERREQGSGGVEPRRGLAR